jgi:FtsP/CotA-like multicopper oxidase with cupredoxin domain
MTLRVLACSLVVSIAFAAPALAEPASPGLPHIDANDNQVPAGHLQGGVLTLHLELQTGRWCPESEENQHLEVYAFGEAGGPPRNPGPFVRVPQGTTIRASVLNALPVAATVHGLHQHPGSDADVIALAPGETRTVEFPAGEPGTYLYWATTSGRKIADRVGKETSLSGAFVVDRPGTPEPDRTFVLGVWLPDQGPEAGEIPVINGKSWPFSAHLTYATGQTVRWRVIDPTFTDHAMHLHGFYFTVDGVGDGERYERFDEARRRRVVTEHIDPGHVFEMTWIPERVGNWIFHCHMVAHMSPPETLHPKPTGAEAAHAPAHMHDASAGMGGIVVGITVQPGTIEPAAVAVTAPRTLQLLIAENPAKVPRYSLRLNDPAAPPKPPDAGPPKTPLMGPPIVLTRGQPVEIEVRNETTGATAIHWHGIELESYYDGVPGWTGTGEHTTPPVGPGESFVARMRPPRAGTFIYHTHWHDDTQLVNGMYGPLIVLEPGTTYDPDRDRTFLVSLGRYPPFGPLLLVNGTPEPFPMALTTGVTYRFRFINITENEADLRWRMTVDDAVAEWKVVAKDGLDLPPAQVEVARADRGLTVGETWDVEYRAERPGRANLEVWLPTFPVRLTQPLLFDAPK